MFLSFHCAHSCDVMRADSFHKIDWWRWHWFKSIEWKLIKIKCDTFHFFRLLCMLLLGLSCNFFRSVFIFSHRNDADFVLDFGHQRHIFALYVGFLNLYRMPAGRDLRLIPRKKLAIRFSGFGITNKFGIFNASLFIRNFTEKHTDIHGFGCLSQNSNTYQGYTFYSYPVTN